MAIKRIFEESGKIVFQYEKEEGKPLRMDEYFIIRGGIEWIGVNNPGYCCWLGLQNTPTITDKYPLILVAETLNPTQRRDKFFESMTFTAQKTHTEFLCGDLKGDNEHWSDRLSAFVRERNLERILLRDSSQFGSLEDGIPLINQWRNDNALDIKEGTILYDQLQKMTSTDLKEWSERFFAIAAFVRVLSSFEVYRPPALERRFGGMRGPKRKDFHFINWDRKGEKEKKEEPGHFEVFVD